MTLSPEYSALLQQMHEVHKADPKPWGATGRSYIKEFMAWFEELGCTTLLDYGSGAESIRLTLADTNPSIDVRCYDPGIPERASPPDPADFVVCTDVLEHIEPAYLDDVLTHLQRLARKGLFLAIATKAASQILPDGRNAHLIIEPADWWLDRLRKVKGWNVVKYDAGRKTLKVWVASR